MIVSRALRGLSVRRSSISCQLRFHGGVLERGGEGEGISIHTTSVVHPDAVIGKGVSIGPFCTVGSAAKIGDACQLHTGSHILGDSELGDHCVLEVGAIVGADLPGKTIIGSNNTIGHHAVIGIRCQDLKYKQGDECFLYVGCNNDIREYTSIHRSSKSSDQTVIGDNNLIMGSCHIAHDCKFGNNNIFANNTLFAGHVIVGDYAHSAGAVVVHQFCHIGSYSFIGGGSVISQDVPKYVMVSGDRAELRGLNSEGLRRYGFSTTENLHEFQDCNPSLTGVPWTEEEHRQFLAGLEKLGKGYWRSISRDFVPTRTPTQVASHAQKYFLRQNYCSSLNNKKRTRRSSLFNLCAQVGTGEKAGAVHATEEPSSYSFDVNGVLSDGSAIDLNSSSLELR